MHLVVIVNFLDYLAHALIELIDREFSCPLKSIVVLFCVNKGDNQLFKLRVGCSHTPTTQLLSHTLNHIFSRFAVCWLAIILFKVVDFPKSRSNLPVQSTVDSYTGCLVKALDTLIENGIDRAVIYDSVPKTLAQLEKVLGKKKFEELVGEFVVKPQGNPTLADENDSRKEFSSAAADFAEVADNGSK